MTSLYMYILQCPLVTGLKTHTCMILNVILYIILLGQMPYHIVQVHVADDVTELEKQLTSS